MVVWDEKKKKQTKTQYHLLTYHRLNCLSSRPANGVTADTAPALKATLKGTPVRSCAHLLPSSCAYQLIFNWGSLSLLIWNVTSAGAGAHVKDQVSLWASTHIWSSLKTSKSLPEWRGRTRNQRHEFTSLTTEQKSLFSASLCSGEESLLVFMLIHSV